MGKKYLEAVAQESIVFVQRMDEYPKSQHIIKSSGAVDIERQVIPRTERVFLCPRRIHVHRGNLDACGQACQKARGDASPEYEDETYTEVVTLHKRYIVDMAVGMEEL